MALKKIPVLKIENVSKSFGKFKALDDVNLTVNEGEVYGFLGPNGAGKSTTIRIVMNTLRADKGNVSIFDISNRKTKKVHERIGYLSGDMVFEADLKGKQFLNYVNHVYGGGYEERYIDLADLFEIDLNKKIGEYSRGNEQKIGLIAAIMHQPDLLILDEPTNGFDPLMQESFSKIITDFKLQGGTVLMSSHILSEVQQLCDRIAFIKDGSIIGVRNMSGLNKTTTKRVIVYPDKALNAAAIQRYKSLTGLNLIKRTNNYMTFSYSGDTKKLLRFFATQNIKDILIEEPDVEEVFLDYYRSTKKARL